MRLKTLTVSLLIVVLLAGCKKDQLQPTQVTRIPYNNAATRFNRVLFTDSLHGYIVGGQRFADAVMLTTDDGGITWKEQHFPLAAKGLYDITRSPGGALYTIGFDGKLLRSTDAGGNWNFSQTEYYSFTGIAFPTPDTGLAVGGISFREGKVMKVTAQGEAAGSQTFSWQLNKIAMVDAHVGYICGFGAFMKTTDGGRSWQLLQVAGDNFRDLCVIGDEIWLCGDAGSIFHTYDGGKNWQRYRNGNDITLPHYHLTSIVFADRLNGWATGEQGLLLKTEDGGQHWMEYKPFTGNALRHLSLMQDGSLLVVGDGGGVYRVNLQ